MMQTDGASQGMDLGEVLGVLVDLTGSRLLGLSLRRLGC